MRIKLLLRRAIVAEYFFFVQLLSFFSTEKKFLHYIYLNELRKWLCLTFSNSLIYILNKNTPKYLSARFIEKGYLIKFPSTRRATA